MQAAVWVLLDQKALSDLQVQSVQKDLKVPRVSKDSPVKSVLPVPMAHRGHKVNKVCPASKVCPGNRVLKDCKVNPDYTARLDQPVPMAQ